MVQVRVKALNGKTTGWTWTEFEEAVMSWGRLKYGNKYTKGLWHDTLPDISNLDLDDESQWYDFERLCEMVYDVMGKDNVKFATTLYEQDRFWTKKWQIDYRQGQREKLYCYLETVCQGEPLRQLKVEGVDKMNTMRNHLYVRFGGGEPRILNERQRLYFLGMPSQVGKPAMLPDVNMEDKLNELEAERDWLWNACPAHNRANYEPASEERLVRIVMEHVPKNYDDAVERTMANVRLKLIVDGKIDKTHTPLEDLLERNFNSDWLPSYEGLRAELIAQYTKFKLWRGAGASSAPLMMVGGNQPGLFDKPLQCWACGSEGHKVGAQECTAKIGEVHPCAPDYYQKKMKNRGSSSSSNGGKSGGRGTRLCKDYSTGSGYCKWGDNCKFSHDGPKAGGQRERGGGRGREGSRSNRSGRGGGGKGMSQRQVATMVLKNLKRIAESNEGDEKKVSFEDQSGQKKKSKTSSAQEQILHLIRGEKSCFMIGSNPDSQYSVPKIVGWDELKREETPSNKSYSNRATEDSHKTLGLVKTLKWEKHLKTKTSLMLRFSCIALPLHDLNVIGIDTCSAMSVSTKSEDFITIDKSRDAQESISIRGVGGAGSKVGGRGCLVVKARDCKRNSVWVIDPEGVYMEKTRDDPDFRVLGREQWKKHSLRVVEDYQTFENGCLDVLECKKSLKYIALSSDHGIMTMATTRVTHEEKTYIVTNDIIGKVQRGDGSAMIWGCDSEIFSQSENFEHEPLSQRRNGTPSGNNEYPVLVLNEAKLDDIEQARLWHWRTAHSGGDVPMKMGTAQIRLNEDCYCCDQAKYKHKSYKRNSIDAYAKNDPWWRVFCDGYGGQLSMGTESYEGAVGGFVFVCPSSGTVRKKLYATTEQFPAILYQFLQEVETEHFVVRELYVDTYAVNLSKAAEEVAGMFKCKIVPISAGSPQELAFAESAVRTLGRMSRALICGAKHLPGWIWGLADIYATVIHDILPQKTKEDKSPYERRTGKKPDLNKLFIKVFGAPCQYSPMNKPAHKRAKLVEWGWFVGIQWPMVLVVSVDDFKVRSVSRQKIRVYEGAYAKFDPTKHPAGTEIVPRHEEIHGVGDAVPDHVLSIKILSDAQRNAELNESNALEGSESESQPNLVEESSSQDDSKQGENLHIPEHVKQDSSEFLENLENLVEQSNNVQGGDNVREALIKAIQEVHLGSSVAPKKGTLKKTKWYDVVTEDNVVTGKRKATHIGMIPPNKKTSHSVESIVDNAVGGTSYNGKVKPTLKLGMKVKIQSRRFDGNVEGSYSYDKPKWLAGTIVKINKGRVEVQWDIDGETVEVSAHYLTPWYSKDHKKIEKSNKQTTSTVMAMLEVGAELKHSNDDLKSAWPKDFVEAIARSDWREWVAAVKKEVDGWRDCNTSEEVSVEKMARGAKVIPLGELYTIKRDGRYKFRQYAMGNLLREGKDYGETFASTVSGDGLRWFCSLACASGKEIRGWDATTGYLQTEQRIPVYSYLPSHHGYSDLSYEELATFREKILRMKEIDGIEGVKRFSRKLRRETRSSPSTVLQLKTAVYGIPDAGQAFSMFMQGLHIKKAGMVQCEVDPAIYVKVSNSADGKVDGFMVAITWVDDVRYFGTEEMVQQYESTISANCKCTMEGVSKEFVSINMKQNIERGTLELSQEEYWVKAVERFKEFLPKGPKERTVPLTIADAALLVEPTEEEIAAAAHLPLPQLLGVIQYPTAFTKLEMRFAISALSRNRAKWGIIHFALCLKALEYGWSTRKRGLMYTRGTNSEESNILTAYADSGFSSPRSQGCRLVMMNGAAISFTSKRHTTTDDSTAAAELTEQYLCSCDVEGLRQLMSEVGLHQQQPTIIWQDNQAAIQIAMNRGALAKKTRAMNMRTLSVRNKIEDGKVIPMYLRTIDMVADIGTKALDGATFAKLRDIMTGYAVENAHMTKDAEEWKSTMWMTITELVEEDNHHDEVKGWNMF